MLKIVKVKHDPKGTIIAYQLNDGNIVSNREIINMVKDGKISGVMSGVNVDGEKNINLLNGANQIDKIENLPEITDDMEFVIRYVYDNSETKFQDKQEWF